MFRQHWKVITIIVLLFLLVGCSKEKAEPKPDLDDNERDIVAEEVEQKPMYSYPLTGEPTEIQSTNRAVSVMINNHPAARPQSGLNKADLVFEVLAEGGITRLLAVFQSEMPEKVGPVRSARPYYIELAKGLDAIYIFHGWSPDAQKLIQSGYVDDLNGLYYDGTLFNRASFRKAPHNSYITHENIIKGAEQNGYTLEGAPTSYKFLSENDEIDGTAQSNVTISYSNKDFEVHYEYDPSLKKYLRFSGGEQTVDYETNEPVLLNNIFIVQMDHTVIDDVGRRKVDLTSGGKALLLQDGKLREVTWENVDGRIVPYLNGGEVRLVPGKTWINIVPNIEKMVSYE